MILEAIEKAISNQITEITSVVLTVFIGLIIREFELKKLRRKGKLKD